MATTGRDDDVTELFNAARVAHNRLVAVAGELHADGRLRLPQRAVLEYLANHGATTVSDIARARHVTRQHIQQVTNELLDDALARTEPNPAHRRSPLVDLTAEGRAVIDAVRDREAAYLRSRRGEVDAERLRDATAVLRELAAIL